MWWEFAVTAVHYTVLRYEVLYWVASINIDSAVPNLCQVFIYLKPSLAFIDTALTTGLSSPGCSLWSVYHPVTFVPGAPLAHLNPLVEVSTEQVSQVSWGDLPLAYLGNF